MNHTLRCNEPDKHFSFLINPITHTHDIAMKDVYSLLKYEFVNMFANVLTGHIGCLCTV